MKSIIKVGEQSPVYEVVDNVARPLVPIKSPEDAAKWYENANMSITKSATHDLDHIRKQASVRAIFLAVVAAFGGLVALFLFVTFVALFSLLIVCSLLCSYAPSVGGNGEGFESPSDLKWPLSLTLSHFCFFLILSLFYLSLGERNKLN